MKNGNWLQTILKTELHSSVKERMISGIQFDSRKVKSGDVFVAIPGLKVDGTQFAISALEKGASFVISEKQKPETVSDLGWIQVENVRKSLAVISSEFYDNPTKKLTVIGVTGTNGKTTTTYLIKSILDSLGLKTGIIGTTGSLIGDRKVELSHTTPESLELNQLFSQMVSENITHVVMEVSSHALHLNRVHGIDFKVAVFTNLTHDHLDYHGNFENYFAAKKILFDSLSSESFAVENIDDQYGKKIASESKAKISTYGLDTVSSIHGTILSSDIYSMKLKVNAEHECHVFELPLSGKFNAYNTLAAIGVAECLGYKITELEAGLHNAKQVPGRFEKVKSGKGLIGVVDYSHTPDSLEKILQTISEIRKPNQKIITVFGCGGDRDKTKRPIMGEIAGKYSDTVIVTSDNPRTENPNQILQDILVGCKNYSPSVEVDRHIAIEKAVELAQTQDIILVAGKGHEDYQEIIGVKTHFDDREELRKAFLKYEK